jgi:tetratricopeptide (TPR) repeat protein
LAQEAAAEPNPPRAVRLARAAAALGAGQATPQWALVRALWAEGSYGAAIRAVVRAIGCLLRPTAWHEGLWTPPLYFALSATPVVLACLALWLSAQAGAQAGHDLGHLLPRPGRPLGPVVLGGAALGTVAWAAPGPLWAAVALALPVLIYLTPAWRARLSVCCLVTGCALTLLPHVLAPAAWLGSPAGARGRALSDANALWAQQRLPPGEAAAGADLWAQALLARRRGDNAGAQALAERAIAGGQSHPALLVLEANLLWEGKDYPRARAFYEQALAFAPKDSIARYNLSLALLSVAEPRDAEAARLQAFADGGLKLTALAAQAQAVGRLVLEPEPPASLGEGGSGAGAARTAWQALRPTLVGPWPLSWALGALFGLSTLCGLIDWGAALPGMEERLAKGFVPTRRCRRCWALSCPRCAPAAAEAGLCEPCQRAALGADAQALALRDAQEAASLRHYRLISALHEAAAWLVPGAGIALQRSLALGLLVLLTFVAAVRGALCALHLMAPPLGLWALAPGSLPERALLVCCVALAGCCYLMGVLFGRREAM